MLTKKQIKYLKSQAQTLTPSLQIGKNGLSTNLFAQLAEQLEHQELIKISLLQTAPLTTKSFAMALAKALPQVNMVNQIGHTVVVYSQASESKHRTISLKVDQIKG
ncbi:YhbY family RNA-binding protein [Bombilactobacillus folatiphilus]|uniref:YhbY family RNA-binding protein n=1 Tax=Bombilactobacillus folatiphilus TaxID=2923362 RepID=A0ABY4P9X0_9LACO|nr:YhbY family RNA-binding protein [Bombilactobacillus folatiphilus]UQS82543.1 YhbY family RNA-binding protein [Bombilactobacillus folatiphilus]